MELNQARAIAISLVNLLRDKCHRIDIAGSIRRLKPEVKDIELVIVPKYKKLKTGFFEDDFESVQEIDELFRHRDDFKLRPGVDGRTSYGDKNKFLLYNYFETQWVALDVFTATEDNFMMVKFVRTGGAENNKMIARRANELGMNLRIYESAFVDKRGVKYIMNSEEQIYKFLDLRYINPEERR